MGMFLNYDNIASNYIPNNLICSFPVGKSYTKLEIAKASKPYEDYDIHGNLVGYFWRYGETLNLEFNIDGEITVEDDALVLYNSGEQPTVKTEGKLYQKAYNVVDKISWTCTQVLVEDNIFVWTMESEFSYPEDGPKHIYVEASDYLKDKNIVVTIYNFRMHEIYKRVYKGTTKVIFEIDKELSEQMKKGIYYCSLTVFDDNISLPIFNSHDCVLSVK